jgi:type VI protein secretion system component Hcp
LIDTEKKMKKCFLLAALACGLFSVPALALDVVGCLAGSASLAITDDPRNCPPDRRIDAMSVSVSFQNTTTLAGGGSATGKTVPSDLKIAKRVDGTSTTLFRNNVLGTSLTRLLVVAFDNDQRGVVRRVFSLLLTEVSVSQFEISAADTDRTGLPTELTSFRYSIFEFRDDQTGQTYGYNFKTAQSF